MTTPQPVTLTVGRIVHYSSYADNAQGSGIQCLNAMVIRAADPDYVNLRVTTASGLALATDVSHSAAPERPGGTWHWPAEVPTCDDLRDEPAV